MALNADGARAVADALLDAATRIDRYLDNNFQTMSRGEYEAISESAKTLLRVATFMTTTAVGLSIEQMQDEATELKAVIEEARDALESLQGIGKAIRVVAGLADLATAIMARDPRGVFRAVDGLHDTLSD